MTRQLLLEIFSWRLVFPLGLLYILAYFISEMIILKLGMRILKAEVTLKKLLPGAMLGAFFGLFIKPYIPNQLIIFFILVVVMVFLLKIYSKSRLIVCSWVSFVLLVLTALGPLLIIGPLAGADREWGSFFMVNPYGVLVGSLTEAVIPGILLLMLNLFNLQVIPSPNQLLTKVDFFDIYFFTGLFYWSYQSILRLWLGVSNKPRLSTMPLFIEWLVSSSMVVLYYLKKVHDQKKYKKFEEKQTELTNKLEELNNTSNASQPNSGTLPKAYLMLDPREREVLKLVALAKPIKAIAAQLFMDRKTVSNYITRICDKLEMEKEHLPVYAFAIGLVSLEECNIKDELNIKVK